MTDINAETPTLESMSDVSPALEAAPAEPAPEPAPLYEEEGTFGQVSYPEQATGRVVDSMV